MFWKNDLPSEKKRPPLALASVARIVCEARPRLVLLVAYNSPDFLFLYWVDTTYSPGLSSASAFCDKRPRNSMSSCGIPTFLVPQEPSDMQ